MGMTSFSCRPKHADQKPGRPLATWSPAISSRGKVTTGSYAHIDPFNVSLLSNGHCLSPSFMGKKASDRSLRLRACPVEPRCTKESDKF